MRDDLAPLAGMIAAPWIAAGMELGSHSLTHRRLTELDNEEASSELLYSRLRIEAKLGIKCQHFACQWGQPEADLCIDRDPALALAAGNHSFFTAMPRRAAAKTAPWMLPRVQMEPSWGDPELRYAFCR